MVYGLHITTLDGHSRSMIGEVATSMNGNLILRVGRENFPDESWRQTEHVVLTPAEAEEFVAEVREAMGLHDATREGHTLVEADVLARLYALVGEAVEEIGCGDVDDELHISGWDDHAEHVGRLDNVSLSEAAEAINDVQSSLDDLRAAADEQLLERVRTVRRNAEAVRDMLGSIIDNA